jgi:hypothetical protein
MSLSRRAVLSMALSALAAPALIRPALAACGPLDLGKGIAFARQDGSKGLARRGENGEVVIDYVTNRGDWLDRRRVKNGVFEVRRVLAESEYPIVGASAPIFTWTYGKTLIQPEDGAVWKGRVKETFEVTISDENATVQRDTARWEASYRCSDPREVKLSGCIHAALTVEAEWTGKQGNLRQRFVYFPALGLGLETQRDGKANGLVAMTAA